VSACKELKPDIFVVGEDWGDKPHNIDVESYLHAEGSKIIQVSYNPRTSSTKIKQNVIAQSHRGKYLAQEIERKHQKHNNGFQPTHNALDLCSASSLPQSPITFWAAEPRR